MKPDRLSLIGLLLCVLTGLAQADPLSAKLANARFQKETSSVTVDFVLTNNGKEPIRIAERWNSWGAYQWTIQMTNSDGSSFEFGNPQLEWTRNFLTMKTIEPGGEFRLACVLLLRDEESPVKDAKVFMAANAHFSPPLSLKGKFAVEKQSNAGALGTNWIGRIESAAIQLAK